MYFEEMSLGYFEQGRKPLTLGSYQMITQAFLNQLIVSSLPGMALKTNLIL
jgi:hypothetical protein